MSVRAFSEMSYFSAAALRELGYAPTSVDAALKRAGDWFQGNGYC